MIRALKAALAASVTFCFLASPLPAAAQAGQFAAGSQVEGHFGSYWTPCVVLEPQLPTGGYRLRCESLPNQESVFSETDVRFFGQDQPAAIATAPRAVEPQQVQVRTFGDAQAGPRDLAPAARPGRPVLAHVGSNWVACTQLGTQLPTGGYRLHCDSLPQDENVFSESDVRF